MEPPVLNVTEVDTAPKPKAKKPRSEAQMASFKAAVEKLRAKRESEREERQQRKAAEAAQKAEAKAAELKAKIPSAPAPAPAVAPAPVPAAPAHTDLLRDVERLLDDKLARLAPARRRAKAVAESDSDEEHAPPTSKKSLPMAPGPRAAPAPLPAWYDSLFPAPRR